MKILVVDDEKDVQLLFQQRFRREIRAGEVDLHFAHGGDEALAFVKGPYGVDLVLILSDINMPGMSGLDLLAELKAYRPHLRVFMVTAYGDPEKQRAATDLGVDAFLNKPIDFIELRGLINQLVE